jgi:WD40 repeat protein
VCLKFSQKGVYILGGSDKGTLNLWDAQTGVLIESTQAHLGTITSLDVNDELICTGGADSLV